MFKVITLIALLSSFVMAFLGVVLMVHLDVLTGVLLSITGCVCMLRTMYHINNYTPDRQQQLTEFPLPCRYILAAWFFYIYECNLRLRLNFARQYLYRDTNKTLEFNIWLVFNPYCQKRIIIISLYSRIWRVRVL